MGEEQWAYEFSQAAKISQLAKISHPAKILQAMKENFHAENYSPTHCDTCKTED